MSQGRGPYALESRTWRLGLLYRRRRREPLVSRRTGQLLDDVAEIVLVDIVDRRLVLVLGLRLLTLMVKGGRRGSLEENTIGRVRVGFGDLVRKLVELLQVMVFVTGVARITAFIHYTKRTRTRIEIKIKP